MIFEWMENMFHADWIDVHNQLTAIVLSTLGKCCGVVECEHTSWMFAHKQLEQHYTEL